MTLRSTLRRWRMILAPPGTSPFQWHPSRALERLSTQPLAWWFFPLVAVGIGVGVPMLFTLIWTSTDSGLRSGLAAVIGYNTLVVVSSLTLAALGAYIIFGLLALCNVLSFRVDRIAGSRRVAICVGYGTAAGLVGAALLPTFATLPLLGTLPRAEGFGGTALPPNILVELPAVGAILGYCVGLVLASRTMCHESRSIAVHGSMGPLILIAALAVVVGVGLGPGSLLRKLQRVFPKVDPGDCGVELILTNRDKPAHLFQLVEACGDGRVYLDDGGFLVAAIALTLLIVGVPFVRDARRRSKKLSGESFDGPIRDF